MREDPEDVTHLVVVGCCLTRRADKGHEAFSFRPSQEAMSEIGSLIVVHTSTRGPFREMPGIGGDENLHVCL